MKNKKIVLLAFTVFLCYSAVFAQTDKKQQRYFDINKNIDIINNVFREMDMFYVDSIDVNKTMRSAIDNMLNGLDPYTVYYDEENTKDFNTITTGEYAGIGAMIAFKDDRIVVAEPFEDKPAAKAGLKVGDVILEIDGKDMTKCPKVEGEQYARTLNNYVTSNLKGQPGTIITIKVERPGEKKPIVLKVTREKITVNPVPYYTLLTPNVGYINLNTFSDKSAMEVKKAFLDLKKQGINSLVFDLRENGGGIMEEAIQIVNMFIPKGKIVVSTKGKMKQWERTYRTTLEPIDTEIPIVVLIDKGSASASEIVAGALQDMDRAVLVGDRTFGKGLVQTTRELPYGGVLKVTTSKYYIPSGRCVQAIDYSHRSADGSAGRVPDSLTTVFHTAIGREVRDGGGVSPDIKFEDEKAPNITYYLSNQYVIFDWVTQWAIKNKKIAPATEFTINDSDYEDFKNFVKSKDFKYDKMSEKTMTSLKEVMEFEGYMKNAEAEFKALEAKLVPDLERDLNQFKKDITMMINAEIIKRYYFQKGEFAFILKNDKTLNKAIDVLNDKALYAKKISVETKK